MPVFCARFIHKRREASLPTRRRERKFKTNFRITAKPGHCCLKASTISACSGVNSVRNLLNSAADTCGETCLGAGAVGVSSSGAASGAASVDTVVVLVFTGGWRQGERNLANVEKAPT